MSGPILVVAGVRKSYGTRRILDVSRLELASGKSYVLTGDNGSGKSTLLRVLAGMEDAEVDLYLFNGRPVNLRSYPEWLRHDLIYVHQHPFLFRGSIFDNICYGLKARGMTRASCESQVREAIVWAGVDELLDVPSHRLSGGEKQRVALARARVLHPRLFLLDEPTANLDAAARQQTLRLIRDLCNANSTVVLACHDREIIKLPHMLRLHMRNGIMEFQNDSDPNGMI